MDYLSEKARRLEQYVAGMQPRETGWIKLNTNENPYPPSPEVARSLKNADLARLRLYPDYDSVGLREAVAWNFGVEEENVFCGNGSDEVLALAYQAFFSGKGNILTPDVSYGFYPVWSRMYDVGEKITPLRDDFTIGADDYKRGNGVVIANPNAPTGIALGVPEIEKIARNNPEGVVVADEAYMDFADRADVESAVSLTAKYENLLVVRTFSKSHSLAGMRVGFAIGSRTLIDGLRRVKNAFNSYPLDFLAQTAATAAILDRDYWNETRRQVIATRGKTAARLRELGYRTLDSQANFLFMEAKATKSAKELYEYLFNNKILVRYWDKPRISGFLRVSIGTDSEMEAFIKCVEKQTRPR
ncbi:MAG: histidinol-phosphate transaminase [Defluviitaleaceae bacterium]|nr:histidinol-phosphate transaminase [Defluviitaleaceae bacterium]